MNKQELIDKLASLVGSIEDFKGISTFHDGKYAGLEHALELIQQLDEQQKLILPKCAEQWIEGHCAPSDVVNLFIEVTCATDSDGFIDSKWRWSTDFYEWLANDADTLYILCDALRYGYEVEKEPLYRVKIGEGYFVEYQGRGALIMPDCNKEIKIFDSKTDAERTAQTIGGTVEEVAKR
ncbi:DUF1642 domain-containing protein [Enterococcus faecium]|uniref:DUF1642 domain-containing protein n=1 Tax=Enterococcus faecium TaxID=1352 RepID=UPI000CF304F3|nr:DUF1642 domain-containing protein [Enterococcus faecium]PQG93559.1 hypothetical protein CUS55_10885 [Enterococcus faecium]